MNAASNSELIIQEATTFGKQGRKAKLLTLATLAVAIIILITGIALIAVAVKKDKDASASSTKHAKSEGGGHSTATSTPTPTPTRIATSEPLTPTTKPSEACQLSEEAQKAELNDFLNRVKATYYKLHPYDVQYDPDVTTERVKTEFVAYDPKPSVIKNRTDTAWKLLEEINSRKINPDALKPKERKALAQVKHYLKHVFGQPYDVNYYAGDWMLGPNLFCWQEICYQGYAVYNGLARHHKPFNASDVLLIKTKLQTHRNGILQYIKNMKMGVRAGMIRSKDECIAGINAIKRAYLNVSRYNATGVLKEWYVAPMLDSNFYSSISKETNTQWMNNHEGKNVSVSVAEYLVTYLGKPLHQMLSYVENEHIRHCVPSNVSSGLASLPLKYVWLDGVENKTWPTTRTLPTMEPLNGTAAYSMIMSYFTTNDMTPLEVHELGKKQLSILYPQVVDIAKQVSGASDNQTAIELFRQKLNSSSSYFNPSPIPKNESGDEAHRKCSDIEGAKKFCPKRWEALQLWFSESRKVMSMLEPKTIPLFYFTGEKATTPTCPVEMQPNLNPSSGAQSYQNSNPDCTRSAKYNIPFFLENLGPTFSEWSVNAHEARPGHHTQVQGNVEHFRDSCGGVIGWLDSVTYYTAFTEGWALYAENPLIAKDTDTYDNEPMQKFGMLKWQVWRALRLIVDTGLHYTGLTREGALKYFSDYAWDDTDLAKKEVTRYQSDPGQATAYMIGQLVIKKARKDANDALGKNFNLRDFHYQVLKQGSSPLAYLTDHVNKYVACMNDDTKEGCDVILNPPKKREAKKRETKVQWPLIPRPFEHHF